MTLNPYIYMHIYIYTLIWLIHLCDMTHWYVCHDSHHLLWAHPLIRKTTNKIGMQNRKSKSVYTHRVAIVRACVKISAVGHESTHHIHVPLWNFSESVLQSFYVANLVVRWLLRIFVSRALHPRAILMKFLEIKSTVISLSKFCGEMTFENLYLCRLDCSMQRREPDMIWWCSCVAVCCSVQWARCDQMALLCCSVLQYAAVNCSELQCGAAQWAQ